jgi:hypothetical protein
MTTFVYYVDSGYWTDGYTSDIVSSYVETAAIVSTSILSKASAIDVKHVSGVASSVVQFKATASCLFVEAAIAQGLSSARSEATRARLAFAAGDARSAASLSVASVRVLVDLNIKAQSSAAANATLQLLPAAQSTTSTNASASARFLWVAPELDNDAPSWVGANTDTSSWTDTDPATGNWS